MKFYVDCPEDTDGFPEDYSPGAMSSEDEIGFGGNIYVDPSGVITDVCNSDAPLDGVTVTLLKESPPGTGNFVVPATADHIADVNPLATSSDGKYGWVVVPGKYKVRAEKAGYVTGESVVVSIPPAATDVNIPLDCDTDGDGFGSLTDNCPGMANASQTDGDTDTVGTACDNCPTTANANQANADGDTPGDMCDNCPTTATPWIVPASDGDCDGFNDTAETAMGTDEGTDCGFTPGAPNQSETWPADLVENNAVNISDVLALKPVYGTAVPPTSVRFDLVPSGAINISDVLALKPVFGKSCTP